ncbi:hypothetical protein SMICM304S_05742 [Streptomyces microflavus]
MSRQAGDQAAGSAEGGASTSMQLNEVDDMIAAEKENGTIFEQWGGNGRAGPTRSTACSV